MKHLASRLPATLLTVLGVGITLAMAASTAQARNQCAAAKLEATGKTINALFGCHAKAVAKGIPLDSACVQQANTRLQTAFAKAESTDTCRASDDAPTLQGQIAALVTEVAADLGGPGPSQCTQQKLRAAGKKALMLHKCFAEAAAIGPGQGGDYKCLERADDQFVGAFFKAETKGDCLAPGGFPEVIADQIDAGLVESRFALAPPILDCEPVMVTAAHGTDPFFGNAGLSKIEDGKVPCAHIEEAKTAMCVFSTTSGSESGAWVETPQGNYARTGQALSLQGVPGGEYVIGAGVSEEGTMPCIDPTGGDTTGTASSVPLATGCMTETLNSAHNAGGPLAKLENYATREVCTSSFPHPDDRVEGGQAVPDRTDDCGHAPPDVYCPFCYTGKGAALNDSGGRERDINGVYLPDTRYCHLLMLTPSFSVWASKRPATAGAVVNDKTPIVWRPVSPVPNIAN